uniref:INTS8 TPR repeats domain-containing protein n=1 Tax=Arcella intermedia TaxID=1963864 RepID=A0A6B2LKT9_9EUKA
MIAGLTATNEFTHAIVLHQFLPTLDYAEVYKIVKENFSNLDSQYFQYIWDMNILEILTFTFAKNKNQEKDLEYVKFLIGKPELNVYNQSATRKKLIANLKLTYLQHLSAILLTDLSFLPTELLPNPLNT